MIAMNDFIFENSTKVYFGKKCVPKYLPGEIKNYGDTVLLATGGRSVKENGIFDEIYSILTGAGKRVVTFDGIMPNPTLSKALEGAALARDAQVDLILAIGGGSVMDCAKCISMAAVYEGDIWEDFWAKEGVVDFTPLPLGVIVTCAGTGSEVNGGAVITNEEIHVKTDIDYPKCNPKFAMEDPTYTFTLPKRNLAASGFDILSHMMEIYFGLPHGNNVSDDINEALMRGVIRDLRASLKDPCDYEARSNLMWASSMAENRIIKLGKKTDFQCHQMEHQLSAYTNCNHGEGLGILHPTYYRHVCGGALDKFVRFATNVWGLEPAVYEDEKALALAGIDALEAFIKELQMPMKLSEIGIGADADLKAIAYSCNISKGSPRILTHDEIYQIFLECR